MIAHRNDTRTPTQIEIEEHPNDIREQIRALTEGIRILTSILRTPSECPDGIKRIEQLQSTWRLEDTGFSCLFNACTQMQNTLHLTSLESDRNFNECERVREIASAAKLEEENMKKKVFTLEQEKIELQKKNFILVKDHKKERKVVARSVRNFVDTTLQRIRDIATTTKLEEENMKKEIFTLQKEKTDLQQKKRVRTIIKVGDQNKDRKGIPRAIQISMDTSYEKRNDVLISSIPTTDARDLSDVSNLLYSPGSSISSSEHDSIASENDWRQISLASSESVTNDKCANNERATDRFPKREALQSGRSNIQLKKKARHSNELELLFPSKYAGIQVSSMSIKGYFKDEEALLVCGFMGFDDTLNRRPEFGSRLVRVDDISVENEKWKMHDLVDYIFTKSGPIRMSFCDKHLTMAQIEQLVAIENKAKLPTSNVEN